MKAIYHGDQPLRAVVTQEDVLTRYSEPNQPGKNDANPDGVHAIYQRYPLQGKVLAREEENIHQHTPVLHARQSCWISLILSSQSEM